MSCFLCGHEEARSHHLGCLRAVHPDLTKEMAAKAGLIAPFVVKKVAPDKVEVLKEGTMTTVPVDTACEVEDCDNPKYSDHPRVKYCEDHKDPKNRKE